MISEYLNTLKLYVNSHDELITNLYKSQLIKLPVRLGTVDFHKMCEKVRINGETKDRLSKTCLDTIMQSYFAMREKIHNQEAIINN